MADDDSNFSASPPDGRRAPYEPPAVEDSAVFETLALSCTKTEEEGKCIFTGTTSAS